MDKTKELVQASIDKVHTSISSINMYWDISRNATSVGWDGEKLNDNDLIVIFKVSVMGDVFEFMALHCYSKEYCRYNEKPALVKVKVL